MLFLGESLKKEDKYKIAMQLFHYGIMEETFGINIESIKANGPIRCVSTSSFDIIDEYLENHHFLSAQEEGRIHLEMPLHFD